jgi:hypothetical protein
MIALVLPFLLLPVIGSFLPGRLFRLYYAGYALPCGLIWLNGHVRSALEDGDRLGLGSALMALSLGLAAAGIVLRLLSDHLFGTADDRSPAPRNAWSDEAVPLGLLLAIFVFHWLSNRLAGFSPSSAAHAIVAGLAALALLPMVRRRPIVAPRQAVRVGAAAFLVATVALTVNAARDGYALAARGARAAGGRPYCLLTYAGTGRPKRAESGWDLSPLVMRANGRHAVEGSPWLGIRLPTGWTWYEGRNQGFRRLVAQDDSRTRIAAASCRSG